MLDTTPDTNRLTFMVPLSPIVHRMDTDAELQNRARAGDAKAFGQLIQNWDHDLRGVVWAVVRSPVATDDVMQTAYEKAFRAIGSFEGKASMKTWLHSICYRSAIDYVRYESRRRHEQIHPDESQSVLPLRGDAHDAVADRIEVEQALLALDPDQRAALMMTAWLGYSFDEVATITGQRRGTVASKVSRARKKLRGLEVAALQIQDKDASQ